MSYLLSVIRAGIRSSISPSITGIDNQSGTKTKLELTSSTVTEESTPVGFIVSTYTLTVYSGDDVTVGFANGSNDNGYYEIDGNDVKLTSAGFDALNLGTIMPNVGLRTSDGVTKYNQVTTVLVDDTTYLVVNNGTVTQGVTVAGDIVCSFEASDEDNDLTFDFATGTNDDNYYSIDGLNVLLTTQGEAFLNEGNEMPNVSITTNTGVTASNTVTTELTPDDPRWYWNMLSPSYASFPDAVNIDGAFSHKLTGKFSASSFHLLSNQEGASFRVFMSGTSYNLFAGTVSNVLPVVSLGQTIRKSLETGVHTLEYGRDDLGEWYVKIDDVAVGSTVNLYPDFVSYNTFGSEIEGSGVPAFNNYHWNHEIKGVRVTGSEYLTGELIMPFDEGFNAEHESLEESNNLIITKVGDVAARYTQTMPS